MTASDWLLMAPPTIMAGAAWLEIRRYNVRVDQIHALVNSHRDLLLAELATAKQEILTLRIELLSLKETPHETP